MVIGVVVVLGAAVSLARGGRITNLRTVRLRLPALLLVVAVGQLVLARVGPGGVTATTGVVVGHLVVQSCVLAWVLANGLRRGMPAIGLGALLNAVVVVANRGMPVDGAALERLGVASADAVFTGSHHLATAATRLSLLCDRLPIPVVDTIVSAGDVLVAVGLLLLSDDLLRPRAPASPWPASTSG